MREGGGDKKSEAAKSGMSFNNKPDNSTSLEETPRHDTRKEIASNLGWSPAKVAQAEVVRKEDPEKGG